MGIARDGHVIYGPKNLLADEWTCSNHDVCHGQFFGDNHYAYVANDSFPYVVGCWGPGAPQTHYPSCSHFACASEKITFSSAVTLATSAVGIAVV